MEIQYNIGGLKPEVFNRVNSKYIVTGSLEGEVSRLSLYANTEASEHSDVAVHFSVRSRNEQILGGGKIEVYEDDVHFFDLSGNYGAVPKIVIEGFGRLLSDGKKTISVNPWDHVVDWNKWQKFGIKKE